ncbi:hypothetical protein E2C01_002317 [Portunus trituberculatus]|uniref:Uncharacterized protein n=1 Tax=Portunus trituberculatus TaxID=210409 RepID=A0A5B7CK24_PORTR|nr:hypothetical protein [Portunus trituberculatus]
MKYHQCPYTHPLLAYLQQGHCTFNAKEEPRSIVVLILSSGTTRHEDLPVKSNSSILPGGSTLSALARFPHSKFEVKVKGPMVSSMVVVGWPARVPVRVAKKCWPSYSLTSHGAAEENKTMQELYLKGLIITVSRGMHSVTDYWGFR